MTFLVGHVADHTGILSKKISQGTRNYLRDSDRLSGRKRRRRVLLSTGLRRSHSVAVLLGVHVYFESRASSRGRKGFVPIGNEWKP